MLDCDAAREAGITFERLRDEGALRVTEPGIARFAEGGFPTPGGKLRMLAPELAASGNDPLIGYVPPHELEDPELAKRFPLALLSPASRFVLNSTFASLPWHRKGLGGPTVHLHPVDAGERGIETGARVRVHNDRGAFNAEAVDRRCRAARRRVHLQAAVAAAARPRRARQRHDRRARRRPRRQPDVPRQPGADRARVTRPPDLT